MSLIPQQGTATIGATAIDQFSDCPATLFRTVIYVKNTSIGGQKMSVGDGIDAVAGSGATFLPGESFVDSWDGYHEPTQNKISIVFDGAGGTIAFMIKSIPYQEYLKLRK